MYCLVVTIPDANYRDLRTLRDYVAESLSLGIVVQTPGTTWELAELPELGRAAIQIQGTADAPGLKSQITGSGAPEKRKIAEALRKYRDAHGLGCLGEIAQAAGQGVTEETVRTALGCGRLPVTVWRRIGKGLEQINKVESEVTGNGSQTD